MGLTIDICNDVEQYEESVVAGFNLKKTLCIGAAVIVGAAGMALFHFAFHINILVSVYMMMPLVAPIIIKGFYREGKGSLLKDILGMGKKSKPLVFRSTETAPVETVQDEKKERSGWEKVRIRIMKNNRKV
ncbi:MAG: PrgI family protein [Lachnospiraceae bacterium]|nr:PrgI family protein [Lachnospiraceae bacterium]